MVSEDGSLNSLLRAQLERLRREKPEAISQLLREAVGSPKPSTRGTVGPALPTRTQHHTPMESESRFVRHAAWWEDTSCQTCGHTERKFDGIYEEREWLGDTVRAGGPKHWLGVLAKPLPETLRGAVSYVRFYTVVFCHKCVNAESWPLEGGYKPEHVQLATTIQLNKDLT